MFEERGLSDVIAFTLTFAIIILSVSTVSIFGVNQLTDARDRQQVKNAERGMVAVATTFDDISRQGAQFRATRIALHDGSLDTRESTFQVRVNRSGKSNWSQSYNVSALQLELEKSFGRTVISYEGGGVFRSDGDGASYTPSLLCAPEQRKAVLTIVAMNGTASTGAGSTRFDVGPDQLPEEPPIEDVEQTRNLFGSLNETNVTYAAFDSSVNKSVSLNVSGMQSEDGWQEYLNDGDNGWNYVGGPDYQYRCTDHELDTVIVRVVRIDLVVTG